MSGFVIGGGLGGHLVSRPGLVVAAAHGTSGPPTGVGLVVATGFAGLADFLRQTAVQSTTR